MFKSTEYALQGIHSPNINESYLKKYLNYKFSKIKGDQCKKVILKRYFVLLYFHSYIHVWAILTKCHLDDILSKMS